MEIIGKYKDKLIVECNGGFRHAIRLASSGCFFCEHVKGETYFDFVDVTKLPELSSLK